MKRVLFCCLLLCRLSAVSAQQNRFIYIQTENKQPFYVKVDKKVFSSASSGYLVIPRLTDGTYTLSVGFPKNEWPEQQIACRVDKKDAGYMLKNFGDKGWGLFNLQTLEVLMAGNTAGASEPVAVENKKDEFSALLSNAVNDSTIRKVEVVKAAPQQEVPQPAKAAPAVAREVAPAPAAINRILYVDSKEGLQMVYAVTGNGSADTIRLLIPADKQPVAEPAAKEPEKEPAEQPLKPQPVSQQAAVAPAQESKEKFIEMELPNPNAAKDSKPAAVAEVQAPAAEKAKEAAPQSKKVQMINSNCRNYAVEEDFLKLRKKMAAEDNDDDMVATARKTFKTKCFTVEQVKNLCVLFLKDEGRYKFFDAAYPFVSDSENFPSLRSQLSDAYHLNRFDAMIRH